MIRRIMGTYGSILVSVIVCTIISSIFATFFLSSIINILMTLAAVYFSFLVYCKMRDSENNTKGYTDKWQDLLFLLGNYEIDDQNKTIFCDYIQSVKSETDYPPIKIILKTNRLLKHRGLESLCFNTSQLINSVVNVLKPALISFGLCGMFSSAVSYSFLVNPLSALFWVSLFAFIAGLVVHIFMSDTFYKRVALCVIGGIVIISFLVSAFVTSGKWEGRCNDISIYITEKVTSTQKSSYTDGYVSCFKMIINNKKKYDISEIRGNMCIYNKEGELLDSSVLSLSGDIQQGNTSEFLITVDRPDGDNSIELYYSEMENLRITFKITHLLFYGKARKEYPDSRLMEVLPLNTKSGNSIVAN